MIYSIFTIVGFTALFHYFYKKLQSDIPLFTGFLPIIGHTLELGKPDVFKKMAIAAKTTPIFKLSIFLRDIAVIVDPKMLPDYFKIPEKEMSMYDVLENLYFGKALSDNDSSFAKIISIIRKSLNMNLSEYVNTIAEEATFEISKMTSDPTDVLAVCKSFVANTSSKCFLGRRLTDLEYEILKKFSALLNFVIITTYFLPHWAITMLWGKKLRALRVQLRESFYPDIEKFIDKTNTTTSKIIHYSLDTQNDNVSRSQTLINTGDIIVSLLYVATENTALGISNTVYDVITHPEVWNEMQKQLRTCKEDEILTNDYIDSVIWETARTNSHMFSLNRASVKQKFFYGHDVSGVDSLVVSNHVMLVYGEEAASKFVNPTKYDPLRFKSKDSLKTMKNIITWGSGVHGCVGRLFAQYETKIFLYYLCKTTTTMRRISKYGELNYFSPSAYAERKYLAEFNLTNIRCVSMVNGEKVYIARNFVSVSEQKAILANLCNIGTSTTKSGNFKVLKYHNLAYTAKSNAEYINFEFINRLIAKVDCLKDFNPNSFYSVAMRNGMVAHRDKYVSMGVSLSLGADADFVMGDKTFRLRSGDVIVADFGNLPHGIKTVYHNTVPSWFDAIMLDGNFVRCSLQIREVRQYASPLLTTKEFLDMQ
jgi:cytochrome P450